MTVGPCEHFFLLVKMFIQDQTFEGIPRENKYFGQLRAHVVGTISQECINF